MHVGVVMFLVSIFALPDAWSSAALGTGVGIGVAACIGLALLVAVPLLVFKYRARTPRICKSCVGDFESNILGINYVIFL